MKQLADVPAGGSGRQQPMKTNTMLIGLMIVALAAPAAAANKSELDDHIRAMTVRFDAMQLNAEKAIPADTLNKAQGIILLERTKAGFLFAYQGGAGVAM